MFSTLVQQCCIISRIYEYVVLFSSFLYCLFCCVKMSPVFCICMYVVLFSLVLYFLFCYVKLSYTVSCVCAATALNITLVSSVHPHNNYSLHYTISQSIIYLSYPLSIYLFTYLFIFLQIIQFMFCCFIKYMLYIRIYILFKYDCVFWMTFLPVSFDLVTLIVATRANLRAFLELINSKNRTKIFNV